MGGWVGAGAGGGGAARCDADARAVALGRVVMLENVVGATGQARPQPQCYSVLAGRPTPQHRSPATACSWPQTPPGGRRGAESRAPDLPAPLPGVDAAAHADLDGRRLGLPKVVLGSLLGSGRHVLAACGAWGQAVGAGTRTCMHACIHMYACMHARQAGAASACAASGARCVYGVPKTRKARMGRQWRPRRRWGQRRLAGRRRPHPFVAAAARAAAGRAGPPARIASSFSSVQLGSCATLPALYFLCRARACARVCVWVRLGVCG